MTTEISVESLLKQVENLRAELNQVNAERLHLLESVKSTKEKDKEKKEKSKFPFF